MTVQPWPLLLCASQGACATAATRSQAGALDRSASTCRLVVACCKQPSLHRGWQGPAQRLQLAASGPGDPPWLIGGSGCMHTSNTMAGKGPGLRCHNKDLASRGSSTNVPGMLMYSKSKLWGFFALSPKTLLTPA